MHVTEREREKERETECVKEADANGIVEPGRNRESGAAFVGGSERKHVIFDLQKSPSSSATWSSRQYLGENHLFGWKVLHIIQFRSAVTTKT